MPQSTLRSTCLRLLGRGARRHFAAFERVLGTSLEIDLRVDRSADVGTVEECVIAEIGRYERIFSTFLPDSELRRWSSTRDRFIEISEPLAAALESAERWRSLTRGAFDPRVERFAELWRLREVAAEPEHGGPPAPVESDEAPWAVERSEGPVRAMKITPHPISLDALAKGIIIDRACERAAGEPGVRSALINIGGDLRYIGSESVRVGVADARADAENAPPIDVVHLRGQGMATSGSYRRGFRIAGRHFSHILDPRTGEPAAAALSVSVVAPTAADADVLATAFSVLPTEQSLAIADSLGEIACLIIAHDGTRFANEQWTDLRSSLQPRAAAR